MILINDKFYTNQEIACLVAVSLVAVEVGCGNFVCNFKYAHQRTTFTKENFVKYTSSALAKFGINIDFYVIDEEIGWIDFLTVQISKDTVNEFKTLVNLI